MTQEHVIDKKKLIILRAALILIGGALGATALWQYFVFYPNAVKREFQIVIIVVSSAVAAALLGLSAKPLYRLFESVLSAIGSVAGRLGAKGVAAVILGLISAGILAFLTDVIIRASLDIWAVRLLSDVLAFMAFSAVFCFGFTKWLAEPDELSFAPLPNAGYLLSVECFNDERVFTAVCSLSNVRVCDGAYKALSLFGIDGGTEAASRLETLIKSGRVKLIKSDQGFSDADGYTATERKVAQNKGLRYVQTTCEPSVDGDVGLNMFAPPSEKLLQMLTASADGVEGEADGKQKIYEDGGSNAVGGQIIIDK